MNGGGRYASACRSAPVGSSVSWTCSATLRSGRAQVCFWEDDGDQFNDPDYEGGANEVSLRQARDNYREFVVSQLRFRANVRPPRSDEQP